MRDAAGNLVPNTWLMAMDYQNAEFDNSDYQDLVFLVSNMRPSTQPPAPADLQASASGGAVTLQWAPASDSGLAGYNVYRASSASGPYTKLNSSPIGQTNFVDSNPGSGTAYYHVTAVDSSGESLASNASAKPAGTVGGGNNNPPPTNLTPAQQVAADKTALLAARQQRILDIKAARVAIATARKTLNTAQRTLRVAQATARRAHLPLNSIDPLLTQAVDQAKNGLLTAQTALSQVRKTDAATIKTAQVQLATDQKALRAFLRAQRLAARQARIAARQAQATSR